MSILRPDRIAPIAAASMLMVFGCAVDQQARQGNNCLPVSELSPTTGTQAPGW